MTYRSRALGCGCGCAGRGGCGGLGTETTASTLSPAGEINGIATLAQDVRRLTTELSERWGGPVQFNRSMYQRLLAKARRNQLRRLTNEESRQFVTGVVGDVGGAIVTARALALHGVASERERAANHATQASLIGPARLVWDAMGDMFRYATPELVAASGLGIEPITMIIIAGAVVYLLVAVACLTALTYLVDSQMRLAEARREAESACRRSGGCTPEQYARIRRELAVGPFDGAIQAAGEGIGTATTVVVVAGSAVIAGLALWGGWKIWKAQKAVMA